jgi:hypothetical protein
LAASVHALCALGRQAGRASSDDGPRYRRH